MKPVRKKSDAPVAAATAKHIEIVRSTKPWLSSMSRVSSDAILAVLSKHYARVGVTVVNDLADLERLVALRPDLVFLGMKFVPGGPAPDRHSPKVWLADYLDGHGIAYTGSDQGAHELELDKQLAKQRVLAAGFSTAPFYVARQDRQLERADLRLRFPLFIKPTDRGGGLGIDSASVANNFHELKAKVQSIAIRLGSDSLVEQYLPGREFSVAILKDEASDEYAAMPLELVAPPDRHGFRLLSGKVKAANSECVIPVTDRAVKAKVTALAMGAFEALGARDYGRIDIRLDQAGNPHFLEANLLPSLISGYGSFPKACALNMQLGYAPMILSIAKLGLARQPVPNNDVSELPRAGILPILEAAF